MKLTMPGNAIAHHQRQWGEPVEEWERRKSKDTDTLCATAQWGGSNYLVSAFARYNGLTRARSYALCAFRIVTSSGCGRCEVVWLESRPVYPSARKRILLCVYSVFGILIAISDAQPLRQWKHLCSKIWPEHRWSSRHQTRESRLEDPDYGVQSINSTANRRSDCLPTERNRMETAGGIRNGTRQDAESCNASSSLSLSLSLSLLETNLAEIATEEVLKVKSLSNLVVRLP